MSKRLLAKLTPRQQEIVAAYNDITRYPRQLDVAAALGMRASSLSDLLPAIRKKAAGVLIDRPRQPAAAPAAAPAPAPAPAPADKSVATDPQVKALRAQLAATQKEQLDAAFIKREIVKLAEAPRDPPDWLINPGKPGGVLGVPTLFASDWHWAENVDPRQINGVNEYNLSIAHDRARRMIEKATMLLRNCFQGAQYPGIVFALGGDMVSGDIHEELMATNDMEIMPAVNDLVDVLAWCIRTLADEFGRVFIPCVGGNHGRNTHKIRAKGRNFTSFDWLIYVFLDKLFTDDKRVTFYIPDGPDAYYRVYGTRYLLTHGDQFRGGDGMIGALGPIIRGDHKKRSRAGQVDMGYDVLMLGHWHQLIQMQRVIVNGSLKGYDEYAYSNNFPFERAQQALWITHPQHGITFSMPVRVDEPRTAGGDGWVSVPE